jgi:hypothetical protein
MYMSVTYVLMLWLHVAEATHITIRMLPANC